VVAHFPHDLNFPAETQRHDSKGGFGGIHVRSSFFFLVYGLLCGEIAKQEETKILKRKKRRKGGNLYKTWSLLKHF